MNPPNPNCFLLENSQQLHENERDESLKHYSSYYDGWVIPFTSPNILELLSLYGHLYPPKKIYEPMFDIPYEEKKTKIFPRSSFKQLLSLPPKQWLVENVFGKGDLGVIFGPSGCGKTFVIIDLIMRLSLGRRWAHRFNVARPLNVAYCAGEGLGALSSRFKIAAKHQNVDDLPSFTFFQNVPQLFDNEGEKCMNQFIHEYLEEQKNNNAPPLDLLIIDTLHTASCGANENDAEDMGIILASCKRATDALGCAILLVHHTNKDESGERGSTALRGSCDFMIWIKKADTKSTNAVMTCSKLKDGEEWQPQNFNLGKIEGFDSVHVLWDIPGSQESFSPSKESSKRKILETLKFHYPHQFKCKALADLIGRDEKFTNKLLVELVDQGLCIRSVANSSNKISKNNPWLFSHNLAF